MRYDVEKIKDAADIVEVVGSYTALKKAGASYAGPCPFCNEAKGFNVNPAKDLYKCFKCGKGGNNAITFVMQKEGVEFKIALKKLADRFNVLPE